MNLGGALVDDERRSVASAATTSLLHISVLHVIPHILHLSSFVKVERCVCSAYRASHLVMAVCN